MRTKQRPVKLTWRGLSCYCNKLFILSKTITQLATNSVLFEFPTF